MKVRVTKKAIRENYREIISVYYCRLQNVLMYRDCNFYTTRAEGWGADIYDVDGVAIVTGYDPFGNINPSYELCKKFDDEASDVLYAYHYDYEHCRTALDGILMRFINAAIEEHKNKGGRK